MVAHVQSTVSSETNRTAQRIVGTTSPVNQAVYRRSGQSRFNGVVYAAAYCLERVDGKGPFTLRMWVERHGKDDKRTQAGNSQCRGYSVFYFRNADGSPICWYINLEDPLCRTEYGFEYTDLLLDIIASPDLSTWLWDDEDELSDAVNLGQVSSEKAAALYTEGKKAIEWLQLGKSPFNEWVNWSPDSKWQVPVIPEGWGML